MKTKLNEQQIAKLKSIKNNINRLNKTIDFMVVEAYSTLELDPNSDDNYQCDWVFDMLMNDGEFDYCINTAGFEI